MTRMSPDTRERELEKAAREYGLNVVPEGGSTFQHNMNMIIDGHTGIEHAIYPREELFGAMGKQIDDTREVLKLYGNMSSVTVLYVLQRFLERSIPSGEHGLMLSFGPGFSAQRILIRF